MRVMRTARHSEDTMTSSRWRGTTTTTRKRTHEPHPVSLLAPRENNNKKKNTTTTTNDNTKHRALRTPSRRRGRWSRNTTILILVVVIVVLGLDRVRRRTRRVQFTEPATVGRRAGGNSSSSSRPTTASSTTVRHRHDDDSRNNSSSIPWMKQDDAMEETNRTNTVPVGVVADTNGNTNNNNSNNDRRSRCWVTPSKTNSGVVIPPPPRRLIFTYHTNLLQLYDDASRQRKRTVAAADAAAAADDAADDADTDESTIQHIVNSIPNLSTVEKTFTRNMIQTIRKYKKHFRQSRQQQQQEQDGSIRNNTNTTTDIGANPSVETIFLTDDDCRRIINEASSSSSEDNADADDNGMRRIDFPTLLTYFNTEPEGKYRADICRIVDLYLHGGYYFDLDLEVITPYVIREEEPGSSPLFVTAQETQSFGTFGFFQAFVVGIPYHPILYYALQEMITYYQAAQGTTTTNLGTSTLKRAYERYVIECLVVVQKKNNNNQQIQGSTTGTKYDRRTTTIPKENSRNTATTNTTMTLSASYCVDGWKQTGNCDPVTGPREPNNDIPCEGKIWTGSSGYCACQNKNNIGSGCNDDNGSNCHTLCRRDATENNNARAVDYGNQKQIQETFNNINNAVYRIVLLEESKLEGPLRKRNDYFSQLPKQQPSSSGSGWGCNFVVHSDDRPYFFSRTMGAKRSNINGAGCW